MPSVPATAVLADATRELGYIEFLRGRYDRVEVWLTRSEAAAAGEATQLARILTVRGCALSDTGSYDAAVGALLEAVDLTDDEPQQSYAWSMVGRVHLLRADLELAAEALDRSMELARRRSWTAFLPWPESLRAEVDIAAGDLSQARARLDHAFAMSCQLGDPCWEGVSARGLGLLRAIDGDVAGALEIFRDARARSTRMPDAYVWVDAYTLEAMADLATRHRLPEAHAWVVELGDLAARTGMRELTVRSLVHRAALGDEASLSVAASLAQGIDNPALSILVATPSDDTS